jgi:flagellar basal-body rod modification protein FlgD
MEIGATGSSSSDVNVVDADQVGFAGLTSESFLTLLITELQNQDPTEPIGNEELLNQLSMMRNLQSNIELGDTLKAITSDQQLSTAATFIGKSITGISTEQEEVAGIADRAFLKDGQVFVGVGDSEIPLSQVSVVTSADAA